MSAVLLQPSFRSRGESSGEMRYPNHPLIVQVRASASTPQAARFGFPLQELGGVSNPAVVCETVSGGLNIYAANEAVASAAKNGLHADYGARFDLFGPEVRYWPGRPMREPVMSLNLRLPLVFGAFVRREILRRRGRIHDNEPARQIVTLRGEAPLASLLGFGCWLDALTDGRGQFSNALVRYAPIGRGSDPEPGPLAA